MKIEIKQALLEGHSPEVIVEAVHANHPHLDKSKLKDKNLSYLAGKNIEQNRKDLADKIRNDRMGRDIARRAEIHSPENYSSSQNSQMKNSLDKKANYLDNRARKNSQLGVLSGGLAQELSNIKLNKRNEVQMAIPRVISSAKN